MKSLRSLLKFDRPGPLFLLGMGLAVLGLNGIFGQSQLAEPEVVYDSSTLPAGDSGVVNIRQVETASSPADSLLDYLEDDSSISSSILPNRDGKTSANKSDLARFKWSGAEGAVPDKANPELPRYIEIPAIELEAPVKFVESDIIQLKDEQFLQWNAPDEFAVGWQNASARLGELGNSVLLGHHNVHGEVFKELESVEEGDLILVHGSTKIFRYFVTNKMILPEKYATLEERKSNALWVSSSDDERLTLVTCWPYESNTHRLIIVARPLDSRPIEISIR